MWAGNYYWNTKSEAANSNEKRLRDESIDYICDIIPEFNLYFEGS